MVALYRTNRPLPCGCRSDAAHVKRRVEATRLMVGAVLSLVRRRLTVSRRSVIFDPRQPDLQVDVLPGAFSLLPLDAAEVDLPPNSGPLDRVAPASIAASWFSRQPVRVFCCEQCDG